MERDAAGEEALRRLHLSPGLRGSGILDGLLTPLARATVAGALGRVEQELFAADWARARAEHGDQACVAHIARTPAQRRHDALVELARRALEVRDRHCTHPGCHEPPERCQGDHIQPWSAGGPTTPDNGQLRCGYHNRWRWQHPDPSEQPYPRDPGGADPETGLDWLEAWRANLRAKILAEQDE